MKNCDDCILTRCVLCLGRNTGRHPPRGRRGEGERQRERESRRRRGGGGGRGVVCVCACVCERERERERAIRLHLSPIALYIFSTPCGLLPLPLHLLVIVPPPQRSARCSHRDPELFHAASLRRHLHGPCSVFFPWPLLPAFTVRSLCSPHGPCFPLSRSVHCVLPMVLASRFHGPFTVFFPWSLLPAFTVRSLCSSHGPCFPLSRSVHCVLPTVLASRFHGPLCSSHGPCFPLSRSAHCVLPMVLASRFHSACFPISVLASRFQSPLIRSFSCSILVPAFTLHPPSPFLVTCFPVLHLAFIYIYVIIFFKVVF